MKAFCVVVGQPLVVARCPLPAGACTWQHRATNFCKYTNQELSIAEHATLVGAEVPKLSEVQAVEQRLSDSIRAQV